MLHAVDNRIIQNCPATREDINMAEVIYGPSVPHLQGKTVRQKVKHVKLVVLSKLLQDIIDKYKRVILCYDPLHINGLDFLNTFLGGILFGTNSLVKNRTINTF